MKKQILLLIGLCLLSAPLDAQVAIATAKELSMISREVAKSVRAGNPFYIPGKARVGRTGLYPFQVKRVMKRRAARTYQQALERQKHFDDRGKFAGAAVTRLSNLSVIEGKRKLSSHTPSYIAARENRLYLQEMNRLENEVYPHIDALFERLKKKAIYSLPHEDPVAFIAQEISPDIQNLFVGETHGFAEIARAVGNLLSQLRHINPQREIILFTEFLPEDFVWEGEIPDVYKDPILFIPGFEIQSKLNLWRRARILGIKVVGLEPLGVCTISECEPRFQPTNLNFSVSLSGSKFRNEQFAQTLQQYRQEHPQALFVVYAGKKHVKYNRFYSLTNWFKPEETFVLSLSPTSERMEEIYNFSSSAIDWAPDGTKFSQSFLYWEDKELSKAAGFDAHIVVEEIKP